MIRTVVLALALGAALARRTAQRAVRSGQARRLSGQHHHDLRQLPLAEGAAGRHCRQAFLRRPVLGRAAVQGDGAQHHAGQGDRHRQLDRRARSRQLLRTGVRPNGVPIAAVMPIGFYNIITDRDMDAIVAYLRTLKPIKNKVPAPIYRFPAKSQTSARRREGLHRGDVEGPGEARLLSRHHRPLLGMPHADGAEGPRLGRSTAWAASNSPGRGASRCRATSPRARPRASAPGPTRRSRRAITTGVDKDGNHLKPPMGFGYYAAHDRRRSRRRDRLSAHGAGEGVALHLSPRAGRGRPPKR